MNQFLKLVTFTFAILALGFTAQSCTTAKTIDKADLAGYWSLKSLKGEAAGDAFKGSIPSLEFDFEGLQVFGSGGCNRYTGAFTLEGNVFKAPVLASTMMMCAEANKEDLFTSTLGNEAGLTVSLDKDILTFKDNNTTVLEFRKGEPAATLTQAFVAVDNKNLVGTWTVSKIKGDDASKLFGENSATLIYADGGAISGNAGCNNYRSNATLEGNKITFGPMMSTKMACPHLEGEQTFSVILAEPVEAVTNGETLTFSQNGEVVLEFVKNNE